MSRVQFAQTIYVYYRSVNRELIEKSLTRECYFDMFGVGLKDYETKMVK